MKISYTIYIWALGLLLLASCSKGRNDFYYKENVVPVTIKGYNGSDEYLEVKLDTFRFDYSPNQPFDATMAWSFTGNQDHVTLSISEKGTGKPVLEKILRRSDGLVRIGFLYLDGKRTELPEPPAITEGKITIKYLFRPTLTHYCEPVDVALVKYYSVPKVFEEIGRLKNVKPNELSEPISISTFPTAGQQYNGQNTPVLFRAYIYKAGTNEFYTEGTGYTWHPTSSIAPLPPAPATAARVYVFSESVLGNSIRFTKNLEL
jgi:hypothetical protein